MALLRSNVRDRVSPSWTRARSSSSSKASLTRSRTFSESETPSRLAPAAETFMERFFQQHIDSRIRRRHAVPSKKSVNRSDAPRPSLTGADGRFLASSGNSRCIQGKVSRTHCTEKRPRCHPHANIIADRIQMVLRCPNRPMASGRGPWCICSRQAVSRPSLVSSLVGPSGPSCPMG
jgi:hypothetical protein